MITGRNEAAKATVLRVAEEMLTAAVTAPKAHGWDFLEGHILSGDDLNVLAGHMRDIYRETGADFFDRDAGNVENSECVLILGIRNDPIHLEHCGYCGFADCADMAAAGANCAFNVTDLGIAIGSAVAAAADDRVDNRVLFSAGRAAMSLGLMGEDVHMVMAIPLSVKGKNPFFDRK